MEVAQPLERYRGLWITTLGLLLLNFIVVALIPPSVVNRGDGTNAVFSGWFAVTVMVQVFLLGLPFIAIVLGTLLTFFLDKKQPFEKCIGRRWLLCLIILYALSAIMFLRQLLLKLTES